MKEIVVWANDVGIFRDVISGIIVTATVATLAFFLRSTIIAFIKKLLPRLESKTPHVNFEVKDYKDKSGEWHSTITVSNAGNEPAYNIYVYYFEEFMNGNFKITASDTNNLITRPVLGIHDSLKFETSGVKFEGCNVTCKQEIWVEYENSLGVTFRVVSEPGTPRGDVAKIRPPKVIKRRLEQLPGVSISGNRWSARHYKKGVRTLLPRPSFLSILKWRLYTNPKFKIQSWYNNRAKV